MFEVAGLDRAYWKDASPIRKVFREAFVGAGLQYFNPHSFRNTLVVLGQEFAGRRKGLKLGARISATKKF
jgi:hypothetical protein